MKKSGFSHFFLSFVVFNAVSPSGATALALRFVLSIPTTIRTTVVCVNSLHATVVRNNTNAQPLCVVSLDLARKKRAKKKGEPPVISEYFAELGRRSSGSAGGKATAARRTPEQRSAAARKAVQARWAKVKARAKRDAARPSGRAAFSVKPGRQATAGHPVLACGQASGRAKE